MPKNTHLRPRRTWAALLLAGLLSLLVAACGPEPAPPVPTRTPAPTFTPTPPVEPTPVDPAAVATIQAAEAATAQAAQQPAAVEANQPAAAPPAEAPPEEEAPTETPTPAPAAEVVATSNMNVRSGPGTTYNILGAANQGQRFPVKGKSPDGTWWQIDFDGQDGWVFGELVAASNTGGVQVAANILAPPPPPTAAPPTNTPPPPPPAEPTAPPPPPKPTYKFNVTAVSKCAPQEAGTWFEGRTYINGQPSNGYRVVFSYEPDGPWVTEPMITGPHKGYEGWNAGYYSHIISASGNGPKEGNWFVWVVDEGGNRISEIANWQSKGKGGDCNQAAVDFDSRQ